VSIPRGFQLVFDDLAANGWSWWTWSDPANHTTWLLAGRPLDDASNDEARVLAVWRDGTWSTGLYRHPDDPVPVGIGARALRPVLQGWQSPRWVRPDLNRPREGSKVPRQDEGTPAHERWSPVIEAGAQAGMDRIAHYNRTREWT